MDPESFTPIQWALGSVMGLFLVVFVGGVASVIFKITLAWLRRTYDQSKTSNKRNYGIWRLLWK